MLRRGTDAARAGIASQQTTNQSLPTAFADFTGLGGLKRTVLATLRKACFLIIFTALFLSVIVIVIVSAIITASQPRTLVQSVLAALFSFQGRTTRTHRVIWHGTSRECEDG